GASGLSLHAWLVSRSDLGALYRKLWSTDETETKFRCLRPSESMRGVLAALNYIEVCDPSLPDPALSEIIPTFFFDDHARVWLGRAQSPLERTVAKVASVQYRRELRQRIRPEWGNVSTAPSALLVVHNSAKKESWKAALETSSHLDDGR